MAKDGGGGTKQRNLGWQTERHVHGVRGVLHCQSANERNSTMLSSQSLALLTPNSNDSQGEVAWKRLFLLTLPRLSLDERRQFGELVSSVCREEARRQLESHVSFSHVSKICELHHQQQQACCRFIKDLLRNGMRRHPEFFRSYQETFQRLCAEIYVEPPSEQEVGDEAAKEFEQLCGGSPSPTMRL